MGITTNLNIGGTKLGDHSYKYNAFNLNELPAGSDIEKSSYRTIAGYGDDREVFQSFQVGTLPISNAPQSDTAESLLETPQGVIPAEGQEITLGDELAVSWDPVASADLYFVRLGVPFFNGLNIESIPFWQGTTPSGTTSLAMRTDSWEGQAALAPCGMYMINIDALSSGSYSYAGGVYPVEFQIITGETPTLFSTNQSIFFTGGDNCGPLMSRIWPYGGASGTEVTITGRYFGTERGASTVSFGAIPVASYVSWSDSQIVVDAPAGGTGAIVQITVEVNGVASNAACFELNP
jgi:hypothetical protein